MRVEYINPFVESTMTVLKSVVSGEATRGAPTLTTNVNSTLGVVIIVGLAGQVSGRVVFDMARETALNIASAMNDETLTEFDELAVATLTELGNMITGNAITKLHELGFSFDITPPALLTGSNLVISESKIEALVVPLELPQGALNINVAIKEN